MFDRMFLSLCFNNDGDDDDDDDDDQLYLTRVTLDSISTVSW